LKELIAYFTVVLLLTGCAQMKPPTGGAQDVDAPVLLKSTPENFSTRFVSKSFVLEFNEFVQLKNIGQQLVVNPPMPVKPDFRLKGKKILVSIKSPLSENTTYVFNFGEAIVDLTEGNKAAGLQYVFSTGDFLDSLMVHGQVLNAFDRKPEENALVMLYSNHSDTMPYKALPDYFGRTNKQGAFEINYIREGIYRAFVLKDENSNYKYNPPTEAMAFMDSLVTPGLADSTNLPLFFNVFKEADTTQFIKDKVLNYFGKAQLVFNQPADSVSVKALSQDVKLITEKGVVGDTLFMWVSNKPELSQLEEIKLVITATPNYTDTLRWSFIKRRADASPKMKIKDNLLFNFDLYQPIRLEFDHPLIAAKSERIELYQDSTRIEFEWRELASARKFEMHFNKKENTEYRVFIPDSTFFDLFNLTNDTLDKRVKVREERYYGNMALNLTFGHQEPFILEMLDDKGNLIHTLKPEKPGIINFNRMLPGNYSLRVIVDANQNGKWDTGNFKEKIQPEKVLVFESAVQIRSNWDLELSWELKLD
jgi:hypothetical protein